MKKYQDLTSENTCKLSGCSTFQDHWLNKQTFSCNFFPLSALLKNRLKLGLGPPSLVKNCQTRSEHSETDSQWKQKIMWPIEPTRQSKCQWNRITSSNILTYEQMVMVRSFIAVICRIYIILVCRSFHLTGNLLFTLLIGPSTFWTKLRFISVFDFCLIINSW